MQVNNLIQRLPRHLKLNELRVFAAVLEHRSFRKAAAVLHLTQPAVTKAIASLEETLGAKLFDRMANGVTPTVHGTCFAPRVTAMFDEMRRAAQELVWLSHGDIGSLRIGTVPMPAIPFLPLALKRLADSRPNIFVSIVEAREAELLDRLRKRDIELAILRMSLVDASEDLRVDTLFDERLCVVASRDHPLAKRKTLSWDELLRERWVLPPADCEFFGHVFRSLSKADLKAPQHMIEAYSIQLQFSMVLHAGMLSFGMRSQVEFAPGREFVVRLPFRLPVEGTSVAAVSLQGHELSPLARQVVSHIRALASTADPASMHDAAERLLQPTG